MVGRIWSWIRAGWDRPGLETAVPESWVAVYYPDAYAKTHAENEAITRADPRNPDKMLVRLIDRAQTSLDGAFYELTAPNVVDALLRAQARGVTVRLVTETDTMYRKGNTAPHEAFQRLLKADIPIVDDQRRGLMHNKFLVVDRHTVWTGSTNATPTGFYRHNNETLHVASKELAADYEAEFNRLFARQFTGPHDLPYPEVDVGGIRIRPYFSPQGGGMEAVLQELKGAQKSIRLLAFVLTYPEMGDVLRDKAAQGVQVEGVLDREQSHQRFSLYHDLTAAGIPLRLDGNPALLHHKAIIVDDQTIITGSFNFSKSAENPNNENLLIIRNAPDLVNRYLEMYRKAQQAAESDAVTIGSRLTNSTGSDDQPRILTR